MLWNERARCTLGSVAISFAIASGSLGVANQAMAEVDAIPASEGHDITKLCGTKPTKVGLADGVGSDAWRHIRNAEFYDEAAKCKNITNVYYTDANGDPQKANSDINSLVARGVDVLIVHMDLPNAQLPAMRKAVKAGVVVVAEPAKIDGKVGVDFSANVYSATDYVAQGSADWLAKVVKKGNVVYLGGTPGQPISQKQFEAFREQLKKYPDLTLLEDNYIVTNWNAADTQKAVAGLIAKYPKIDGMAADYAPVAYAAVRTFQQAGLPVPPAATAGTNNEIACAYLKDRKDGKPWQYLSRDSSTAIARFSLRRGMAIFQGVDSDEPLGMKYVDYVDSTRNMDPVCDPSLPPDADLSANLTPEQLKHALK